MTNERTSPRLARTAGKVLALKREPAPNEWRPSWADTRSAWASLLTQARDAAEHEAIRKGRLPRGHRVVKRHKAVARNGKVRGRGK